MHGHASSSTAVLQNRAFFELGRVLTSGEPGVLSSALPLVVRGSGLPSAAAWSVTEGEIAFVASDGIPLKLRAHLEEPGVADARHFLPQRALRTRRTLVDTHVFGDGETRACRAALEEAGWQNAIAVPILRRGNATGVLLAGSRGTVSGATVSFLEAMANLLGAAIEQGPPKSGRRPRPALHAAAATQVIESLSAVGRELAEQHGALRTLCFRPGSPSETDRLLGHTRSLDRAFRRLCEVTLFPSHASAPIIRRPTSMNTIVDSAVQGARPALALARAELEVVCTPACDFEGDPDLMAIAVRNVVVNAAESFSETSDAVGVPSGRRRVRVCVRAEGPHAAVHLEDSGPGIPHDLRARVFEPSVSTKGPGRGLGLAVARCIVESHGGFLELGASELGGARVSIFIPSRSAVLDELRRAPTVPQAPAVTPPRRALRDSP